MLSYAQNFEDILLWRALRQVENGFYLDIGAQHPRLDSVSRSFYEAGWRGVHVEAHPHFTAQLRADRPDETVVEAAVSDTAGLIRFFDVSLGGLSTGDREIAEKHRSAGFEVRTLTVPSIRLDALFAAIGERDIHWMKIDVEGMESKVIEGWGESLARPWILVIESTAPMSQVPTHEEWIGGVQDRGYSEVFFDGLNRYFLAAAHMGLIDAFAAPANIFDDFSVLPSHPLCQVATQEAKVEIDALTASIATERAATYSQAEALEEAKVEIDALTASIATERAATHSQAEALEEAKVEICALADSVARERAVADHRANAFEEAKIEIDALTKVVAAEQAAAANQAHALQSRHDAVLAEAEEYKGLVNSTQNKLADSYASLAVMAEKALVSYKEGQASRSSEIGRLMSIISEVSAARLALEQARAAELKEAGDLAHVWFKEGQLSRQPELDRLIESATQLSNDLAALELAKEDQYSALKAEFQRFRFDSDKTEARLEKVFRDEVEQRDRAQENLRANSYEIDNLNELLARILNSAFVRIGLFFGFFKYVPAECFTHHVQSSLDDGIQVIDGNVNEINSVIHCVHVNEIVQLNVEASVKNITHIDELMSLNGASFVDHAYQIFLKRSPDRSGREHYIAQLRAGNGKDVVIEAIANSPEAGAMRPKVGGMDAFNNRRRKSRKRFGRSRSDVSSLERLLNRVEFNLSLEQDRLLDRLDRIEFSIDALQSEIVNISGRLESHSPQGGASGAAKGHFGDSVKRSLAISVFTEPGDLVEQLQGQVRGSAEAAIFQATSKIRNSRKE